ncbi:MAG: hypothetical protein LBU06_03945 [Desulfovibrio sp.]|nr:hypothetical protein [Desulfovibrio sp.]
MNPVIKKQTHYNVLLMRDDKEARTFRVHSTLLHFCLYFFLFIVLGGGVSIFLGVRFFDKYRNTVDSRAAMEREISELRLQLERLSNLETVLSASNGSAPKTSYTEVGGGALPARSQNSSLVAARPSAQPSQPAQPASPPAQPSQPAAQSATAASEQGNSTEPAVSSASEAQTGGSGATAGAGEETPPPVEKVVDYPPLSAPDSPLRIGEFSARGIGQQRLRISYELSTTPAVEGQRTIAGSVRYVGVFADGARQDLILTDTDGTRFSIARMKPMQSTARLAQETRVEDLLKIEVFIEIAEGKIYRETYAVRR